MARVMQVPTQSYQNPFPIDTRPIFNAMTFPDPTSTGTTQVNNQVLHPGSRALFRYWEGLRAENPFPRRRQILLDDLKDIMPQLMILEPDRTKSTFRFRLSGTGVDLLFCQTLTGKDALAGWDSFERDVMMRILRVAHESYQPALIRMRLFTDLNEIIGAELLALPVERNDRRGIELFGGLFPFADVNRMAFNRITTRQLVTTRTVWTEHVDGQGSLSARTKPALRVIAGGLTD
jgi:hypothetical protein